jgi:hypothetical protein
MRRPRAIPCHESVQSKAIAALAWCLLSFQLLVGDGMRILRDHRVDDYGSFHFAAVAVAHEDPPYSAQIIGKYAALEGMGAHPYLYPPLLAFLMLPLAQLAVWPARLLWGVLSVAALIFSLYLLARRASVRARGAAAWAPAMIVFVAALYHPFRDCMLLGQVNFFVLLLIVLWWTGRERTAYAGAWLGLAAAIKMSPALLVALPLVHKRWRESALIVGSALLLVAGSCLCMGARALDFPSVVLAGFLPGGRYHDFTIPIHYFSNESIAHFALLATGNPGGDPHRLGPAAAALQLTLISVLFAAWLVRARAMGNERALAALMVLMVIAPTFTWEHHLVFVFVSIAVLLTDEIEHAHEVRFALALLTVAWLCEPFFTPTLPPWPWLAPLTRFAVVPKLPPLLLLFALLLRAGPRRAGLTP